MRSACLLPLLLVAACGDARAPAADETPNLILIIGDDHGYPDFGFMGSPTVRTPNLDRLARGGTVFTTGYSTAPSCQPSLRSLLTGLHPYQWELRLAQLRRRGVRPVVGEEIGDFSTLPRLLAERGYATFQGGKYWEASYELAGFTHGTLTRDWDSNVRPRFANTGPDVALGRTTMAPLYRFIDAHASRPFFVWFAPSLPHMPHDAAPRYTALYRNLDLSAEALGYYANVSRFDDVVGELLLYLDERGLRERTLVVYMSDNGWEQGPRDPWTQLQDGTHGKGSMYELGFRTPIVLNWPGRIPAGAVRGELVSSVDLWPTLLDYAGVPIPAERPGRSLRPLLEYGGEWTRRVLIGGKTWLPNARAFFLRTPRWHYIWFASLGTEALYEIETDPEETRNVVASHRILAAAFQARIRAWQREMRRPFAPAALPSATAAGTPPARTDATGP